jgi:hypothetical protein
MNSLRRTALPDVSKQRAAFIFIYLEDGGSVSLKLPLIYRTKLHHISQDQNIIFVRSTNLRIDA